ncbi:MAG: hypothetical protein WAL59_20020, partial [Roseiarcus sp.]
VHLRFARMGAIVAMCVENYHPRGTPWWIRLEEKGGKSHECTRVTFSERVSTSTSRPPKSATKAGPLFFAWRMIQFGVADIGSRVSADPRAPRQLLKQIYAPISAPRVDSSQSPRHDDNAREPIATRRQRSPFDSDQIATVKMKKPTITSKRPEIACREQTDMSLIEQVIKLAAPHEPDECHRVEITFDKWCRHDAAEVLHADRIRRHTLIDDSPTSG